MRVKVKPVHSKEKPNDEDLFVLVTKRKDIKKLYDFLRSDDAFYAEGRIEVDFVVNALSEELNDAR